MSEKKPDGWSLMGTGTISTEHLVTAIRAIGHHPLWVVSRSREYAKSFSEDLSIPNRATDVRKPLGDDKVGYVYVSAHRARRRHYITAALAGGKSVLTDGPIASTSKAARLMIDASDGSSPLFVNQPFRATTVHQAMKRLVEDGEIGRLCSLLIARSAPPQVRPQRRFEGEETSGNILLDVSVDDIDLARFLTGREPIQVASVPSSTSLAGQQIGYTVEMSGGVLFQAYERFAPTEFESLVLLVGDQGTLAAHGTLDAKGLGTLFRRHGTRNEPIPVRERDPHHATVEEFVAASRRRTLWMSNGHDNLIALRTAECIATSLKRRRTVSVEQH